MLFKDKLQEGRAAAELTQEGLAEASGVPIATIRGYEQGQRKRVTLGVAAKLAKAIGKTCEFFADCEDVAGADEAVPAKKPKGKKK